MKDNLLTAIGAVVLLAAGIFVGATLPRPPCEDGRQSAAEFTLAGREPVALPMECRNGTWVLDADAHPRRVEGGRE